MTAAVAAEPLPITPPEPLSAVYDAVVFSSNDWASASDFAWIYGIVIGWDRAGLLEVAGRYGWSAEKIIRLRQLHRAYRKLQTAEAKLSGKQGTHG
ncbi:hypothetical protein [Arthrobacter caoxuetaonis]|uniref:Uncharacterized protein n=1 Tax=Arthrobacter caoxuetaonis TaxID=2886935 RepID=A0A9X1MIX5_9MICC|nr:hypothetical protein [Arthrobacter caoxuetaonis]MCC3299389.1 hypothetical protein [Arthrobacter caoxuetaonis]USQ59118.1 hypothetical protein NF551_18605 [Arthrobacter caoxuetaonis]